MKTCSQYQVKYPVLLVGGVGRLEPQYRSAAEELGYSLTYRERRCDLARPEKPFAAVVVVQPLSSPKLREAAARLAELCEAPVAYVLSATPAAVRAGIEAAVKETREKADAGPRGVE